ncbi:MAG: hypothetical protein CMN32_10170 [Saprospirales bacterium]|nr:hypothetical protein [Saprospirales bacterium]
MKMKQYLSLCGLLLALAAQLSTLPLNAQNNWLILQKGNRTKILKPEHMVSIGLIYDIAGDSLDCARQKVEGKVVEVANDSAEIEVVMEEINYTKANEVRENIVSQYPSGKVKMKLPLDEVDYIQYQSETARSLQTFGAFVTMAGVALLVASPVMGLESNGGEFGFNNDRFAGWAKAGLMGVGIGTPMILLGRKRTLHLTPSKKKKKVWAFKLR